MVIRTYLCRRCQAEFDFDGKMVAAQCACGSLDVQWVPAGGHILTASTGKRDRYYKELAKLNGFTNLSDAREGEIVAPKVPAPRVSGETYNGITLTGEGCQTIKPGSLPIAANPAPVPAPKMPGLKAQTHIEARWSKSKGEQKGDAA
ncbi:MAG: hypothetical protein KGL39_12400 [Patescibacteria group bacterium]|nr:hypothetical protein [Patescibacteria group bacterium]